MSNLLPQEHKDTIAGLYRERLLTITFFFVFVLAGVGTFFLLPSLYVARLDESDLQAKYDALAKHETSAIKTSLSNSIIDINKRLAVFPPKEAVSPILGDFINPILTAKTPKIHMGAFTYQLDADGARAKVHVSGMADDRASLLVFIDKLKNIKGFYDVDVPISSFIKDTNVPFDATLTAVIMKQSL